MSNDKATPGPWEYHGPYEGENANFSDGDWGIYPPLGESGPVALVNSEANAALIVKAVNLHDELVEALEAYQNSNPLHHDGDAALYHLAEPILAKAKETP